MLPARTVSALCAACLREPSLADAVPLEAFPPGAARLLVRALRAGAVRLDLEGGALAVTIDPDACDVDEATAEVVAAFAVWCATAPADLADEGERLLAYRTQTPKAARVEPIGACDVWSRECALGMRTRLTIDDLWRAACHEREALDAQRYGNAAGAAESMDRAADLLLQYRARSRQAA